MLRKRYHPYSRVTTIRRHANEDNDADDEYYTTDEDDGGLHIDVSKRTIHLYSTINKRNVSKLIRGLKDFASSTSRKPVVLKIFSPGGDAFAGFAMHDALKTLPCDVHTEGYGLVGSAAVLVFAAGTKRSMGANTMVLVHPVKTVLTDIEVKMGDLRDEAKNTQLVQDQYSRILENIGVPKKEVSKMLLGESLFDATYALKLGLCNA